MSAKCEDSTVEKKLTVQRDGEVAASVGNAVKTKLIGHVSDAVFLVCFLRDDLHGSWLCILLGEGIAGFRQVSVQYLHQAMSIAVIMNRASFTGRPYEDQLLTMQDMHQLHALREQRAYCLLDGGRLTKLLLPLPSSTRLRVYPRLASPNAYLPHSMGLLS